MSDHKEYNTPLLKKIGVKPGLPVLLIEPPAVILEIFDNENIDYDQSLQAGKTYYLIWIFTNHVESMESLLQKLRTRIQSNGMIWVSWYKKSAKLPTSLTEDIIRDTALALDLVDIKVAAIDHQWSALKLVIPLERRGK